MAGDPGQPRWLEGPARAVAFAGGLVALVATTIGVVVNWPDDWWPRHPPAPKIYVKGVEYYDNYTVPVAPAALAHPPPDVRFACTRRTGAWLRSLGGVPYGVTIDFVLTTERSDSVVVLGFTPHVHKLPDPPRRTRVDGCAVEAAFIPARSAELAVDSRPPRAEISDEHGRSVDRLGLNLGKNEAADLSLDLYVDEDGAVYEGTVDVDLLVGGERKSLTLSDGGKPFRIAGYLPDPAPVVNQAALLEASYPYCREHPRDPSC
ncbi:hypothetical protein [Streptomyces sp. NPDC093225]|uniref:hypothetical protein n=1 Tax=Streptomyces sp. NPDC093225 TaxID=3366034 RepID=UPI0037F2C50A